MLLEDLPLEIMDPESSESVAAQNGKPYYPKPEEVPAIFWDEMPTDENNADKLALDALKAESTPDELAESHKVIDLGTCIQNIT